MLVTQHPVGNNGIQWVLMVFDGQRRKSADFVGLATGAFAVVLSS
jgi:hypothetical protein